MAGTMVGVLLLTLSVLAVDRTMLALYGPPFELPFECMVERGPGDGHDHGHEVVHDPVTDVDQTLRATIRFNDVVLGVLRDGNDEESLRSRSLPAVEALNKLWRDRAPVRVQVRTVGTRAHIDANGASVLELRPGDCDQCDVTSLASDLSRNIVRAFQRGGRPTELAAEER